jgi:hypothetical protein
MLLSRPSQGLFLAYLFRDMMFMKKTFTPLIGLAIILRFSSSPLKLIVFL